MKKLFLAMSICWFSFPVGASLEQYFQDKAVVDQLLAPPTLEVEAEVSNQNPRISRQRKDDTEVTDLEQLYFEDSIQTKASGTMKRSR